MTFEASRKKQVLVLQPRGKALYEDDSSFGSRMLAKMGWNKGQGLGKEQHGNLEFIQIRYKNNANGLGYDGLKDNQWTENESQFDDLLKKLNGSSSSNNEDKNINELRNVKSLEEKSKRSRARVHYKKFTRGKDVHSYSEKDLANILGKKTFKRNDQTTDPVSQNTFEEKLTPSPSNSNNMIIESGLSVTDYFKQKMKSKHSETSLESSPAEETTENEKISKSKKRKIIQEEAEASDNDEIRISLNIYESNTQNIEKPKKKKKRHLAQIEVVSFHNNELKDKQDTIDEQKELSSNVMKKKSKKPKNEEITNEDTSLKQIKARKSKKSKDIANNHNLENENTELSEQVNKKENESLPQCVPDESNEEKVPKGLNTVHNTNVIQIPSQVAQKLKCMTVDEFINSNIANIIGYGLTENIEIKVVQTKAVDNFMNTDKYSLFNIENMTTRQKGNPRKIMSKIKKIKKSIQVI